MDDEIETLFKEVDTSNDGSISLKELNKMFKKLGVKLTPDDVRAIVYKYDADRSRNISLEEFRLLIKDVFVANKAYEEAYEAFKIFDKDGSNTITADEVREACSALKHVSAEQTEELIKKMDADGNGIISFDEFAKAYACGL